MKRRTTVFLTAAAVVTTGLAAAQWYFSDRGRFTTEPEFTGLARSASGNTLTSPYDPAAALHFSEEYRYLGGQKFILYGVADAEQHFFVETDENDVLQSFYWIQYEAYLPDKSYTYDYDDSPLRVTLGDLEFFSDTAVFEFDPTIKRRRGTDAAMAREFLASHGYRYPRQNAYARLVYLTDASLQKELMIIFIDNLDDYGYAAAQLKEDGDRYARWPEVERALLDQIVGTLDASVNVAASD